MRTETIWRLAPDRADASIIVDARPLYIVPDSETRVELDGPALRVTREEIVAGIYPLQRLCRVYSAERVDWASEALLACAAAGIGVLFVDDDGQIVARLLGRPGVRDELYHRMMEFLLLPEADGMYRHWLDTMRRRAAWWAGLKLEVPETRRDPRACRDWINRLAVRSAGRRDGERSRQWLRGIAYNWMQKHLQDRAFGADNELARSGEPALARDLTDVLMWYLEPARIGWLKRRSLAAQHKGEPVRPPKHEDVARLFESRASRAETRGREITNVLHRWLIHET